MHIILKNNWSKKKKKIGAQVIQADSHWGKKTKKGFYSP